MQGRFDRFHGRKPDDAFSPRQVVDRVLEIHPAALAEAEEAARYYAARVRELPSPSLLNSTLRLPRSNAHLIRF
jgi:hypothetical protein